MKTKFEKYNLYLISVVFTIVLMIFSFRNIEPDYKIGLDSSYMWAVNYLFANDYTQLTELVYPVGPLGFLVFPTTEGSNLLYMLLFYIVMKCWFILSFLGLAFKTNPGKKILAFCIIIFLSFFAKIQFLIIGVCAIHCLWFLEDKKIAHIALAVLIAFVGLCVKTAIGVNAFSIVVMTFLINVFLNRNVKGSLKFIGVGFITALFIGLLIFQSPTLLFDFYKNSLKLALSYSDALSLHPTNNWFLLGGFLLSIFLLPVVIKDKNSRIAFFVFLPSFFAMWKHSISRQDSSHALIMVYFLILFYGIAIVYSKIGKLKLATFAIIGIALYYLNLNNIPNFKGMKVDFFGGDNFVEAVFDYKNFHKKYKNISIDNIQANKLDQEIVDYIGSSSVDVYPWELSFISANNFNWKPRKTLQGGSFAQWLDELSAIDFDENNGPDFILFHYVRDKWGGDFGSIDGRFLLNDNPRTLLKILDNYQVKFNTRKYLLFEKNAGKNIAKVSEEESFEVKWNEWIDVESEKDEMIRMQVNSDNSFLGKIMNFIYKSEPYFIDYLFDDGKFLTYRFIPENAKDGLWIHPFVQYPSVKKTEENVVKVRLRNTYSFLNEETIWCGLERIKLKSFEGALSNKMFLKKEGDLYNILHRTILDFDDQNQHKELSNYKFDDEIYFSGTHSNRIDGGGFSVGFKYDLDSLWKTVDTNINKINLELGVKYINEKSMAKMVAVLSKSDNDFWEGLVMSNNTNLENWEYKIFTKQINRKEHQRGLFEAYIYNVGSSKIYVDDLRMTVGNKAGN